MLKKFFGDGFFQLNEKDVLKGAILAAITVIVTSLYTSLDSGVFPVDWVFWKAQLILGAKVGVAYLIKNLITNSKDQFLKKDTDKI